MDIHKQRFSRRSFLKGAGVTLALGAGGSLVSACKPAATEKASAPVSTVPLKQKAVDLSFWITPYWKGKTGREEEGKETDYYTWKIEEFNKDYPNVSIKVEFTPSTSEGVAKYDTAVAAGNPPDVMHGQSGSHWRYAPQDAIEPFDEWMDPDVISDLIGPAEDVCKYVDGKIYLWPYGMALTGGVFVNRGLFEKAGALDLLPATKERDWTVTEFEKAMEAVTGEIDGQQVYGTVLMTDWYYQPMQFFYGFGANLYNEYQTKMIINSPEGVECMQWLVDLEHKHGWMIPGTAGRTNDVALRLFQEQKVATYPSQPYYVTAFQLQPELKPDFEWYYCQPPHKEGKEIGAEGNIHGFCVAKQDDKDKLAIAMKFVEHLTKPENLEIACWGQGVVPPRKSVLPILEEDPERYVESILAQHLKPFSRLYAEVAPKAITPAWDAAFALEKSPQEALDWMVESANKILRETAEQYGWPLE